MIAHVLQIAHTAQEEHAPEPTALQRRLGAGRAKHMREGGGIVRSEGADAAIGERHKGGNRIVRIRCERLVVPDRAPVLAQPCAELLAVAGHQPAECEASLAQACLGVGRIPIARKQIDLHVDRVAGALEAGCLQETQPCGVANIQPRPEIIRRAVRNVEPRVPICAQPAFELAQQMSCQTLAAIGWVDREQPHPRIGPPLHRACAADHHARQPRAIPHAQLIGRVTVRLLQYVPAQRGQRKSIQRQRALAQIEQGGKIALRQFANLHISL